MKRSELQILFDTLNDREISRCGRFLSINFENGDHPCRKLFNYLSASRESQHFNKEQAYDAIRPNDTYQDMLMRKWMSQLKQSIASYLSLELLEQSPLEQEVMLCKVYNERNARELFKKQYARSQRKLAARAISSDTVYARYALQEQHYEHVTRQQREGQEDLVEILGQLNDFHALEVLRRTCHLMSHQTVKPDEIPLVQIEQALQYAQRAEQREIPAFQMYAAIYSLYRDPTRQQLFARLKTWLDEHWQVFDHHEIRDIYLLIINHCIRQLNQGKREYLREAFNLYRAALDRGLLYDHDHLSPFTYKNLCSIALSLEEYEWADHFLETEKDHLHPDTRENTYRYNKAIYLYKIQDHESAMHLLRTVRFGDDVFNNLTYRTLLMRIYFQLGEWQALDHLMDSFKAFLYRKRSIGYHKALYLNLIRMTRKLMRANLDDKAVRQQLEDAIRQHPKLAEKEWLLAQLKR